MMNETIIDDDLNKQSHKKDSFDDWKPLNLGGLKPGAKDWTSSEIFEEMIEEKYKYLK